MCGFGEGGSILTGCVEITGPEQVRVILETFCRDFKEEVQKRVYFYKSSRLASGQAASALGNKEWGRGARAPELWFCAMCSRGSGIIRIGAGARSGDLTCHTVHIDRRILDFVVGLDTEARPARVACNARAAETTWLTT